MIVMKQRGGVSRLDLALQMAKEVDPALAIDVGGKIIKEMMRRFCIVCRLKYQGISASKKKNSKFWDSTFH